MDLNHGTLHHAIIRSIVDNGDAATPDELATRFGVGRDEIETALRALDDYHGVVLHPGSFEVWVAHPFSLAPTSFRVWSDQREWWSPCAWCALGVVELVGGTGTITTQLGHSARQVMVQVEHGELLDTDLLVHFPVPMARAWDNVIYTCSMMLLFESETAVDTWCGAHRKPRGDVVPIDIVWNFAREWYGRHLDEDWAKWTAAEAAEMFARHGLTGPIWDLPVSAERF
jgi:hypothetical protein